MMEEAADSRRSMAGPSAPTTRKRSRQRKRPRSQHHSNEDLTVQVEVVPWALPATGMTGPPATLPRGWLRVILPYPWAFVTHAKQRWLGRRLVDVYASDFGAYPPEYYDLAIRQGRILVNDTKVDPDYVVRDKDVLSHCVHRHEPAVAVASRDVQIRVVAETKDLLVVDKPPSMPIHPCGGYHKNTLMHIVDTEQNAKHYTIHRLDRLTSGLVLLAKSSEAARRYISVMQQERDSCMKLYLARVKGRFARHLPDDLPRVDCDSQSLPVHGEWPEKIGRQRNAYCFWLSSVNGSNCHDLSLHNFSHREYPLEVWLDVLETQWRTRSFAEVDAGVSDLHWLNIACPTRVEQHKNGVCACGTFSGLVDDTYEATVKSAETSFALIHYDEASDSSLVLCRPTTGRCHQIRLHLQLLGNPIANDPNYGGEMWWGNKDGEHDSRLAISVLDSWDCGDKSTDGIAQQPATASEIDSIGKEIRFHDETLDDFIRRTCVWCKRNQGCRTDRTILEFLSRCPSIHLHALLYSIRLHDEIVSFRTALPNWTFI